MRRAAVVLLALALAAYGLLWTLGRGWFSEPWHAGEAQAPRLSPQTVADRQAAVASAGARIGVAKPRQILFGDLHVHTTFSADAFQMSLPLAGGEGAHPVGDACDFARHCAALDFWSINDHAVTLTPRRWSETVAAIRQCNEVAGDPTDPDVVAYLGWEWTQMGSTPDTHYGHKNVVLRDLEDERIPSRPIAATPPIAAELLEDATPPTVALGLLALLEWGRGGPELARYLAELDVPVCPDGVPVRDLPSDCHEQVATPAELFAKLDDWGSTAIVIPHGTSWGMYTPPGSSWDKQLEPGQHDPARQAVIEVFSGHGNSEEFRPWRAVRIAADGSRSCPEPSADYLPSCWRAGEIVRQRCEAAGEAPGECEARELQARQHFVDADRNGGAWTVPATRPADWQDSGQCRDCFQAAFNYRPHSSTQYIMALARPDRGSDGRFRFGFIASSDNHSARPGTGYKEFARTTFTEARFGNFPGTPLGDGGRRDPAPRSEPFDAATDLPIFAFWETERAASFFLNGGLAAVHAEGRDREAIFRALERREVYGTSGPRILLWFDLLNPPGSQERTLPMGSQVRLSTSPIFRVRAVGSFEQRPGCPEESREALSAERLARLCRGECYHPGETRRTISRIEVVRIRPQTRAGEDVAGLIDDPWRSFPCEPDPAGCRVVFSDEEFASSGRDALYYVRAIEAPSQAVAADPLGCTRDESGRCVELAACWGRPDDDDCLSETEERAWSSPIFVDFASDQAMRD